MFEGLLAAPVAGVDILSKNPPSVWISLPIVLSPADPALSSHITARRVLADKNLLFLPPATTGCYFSGL